MDRKPFLSIALLLAASACVFADPPFEPPPLFVPEGFRVEVAAAPPLVKYPMMACFDERGRLFVAETHGQNLDKQGLLAAKHRFIRMLEDTDRDGKFDKSTIFADQLVMPEGALWHRGSLYVLSSPYLWRFEDTDDDGVADVREKLVGYMEFTGQANQHGAYLGPNGRLYFSGGHLGYDISGKDGRFAAKGRAAAVFSCRLDGTDVEVFGNGGINPVEVAFTAEGELLTTCPIFDSIGGRHDALIHWVRGSTAGPKDYAPPVLKQTGYRLPAVRRWGQVAPSGLTRFRSTAFGKTYRDSFFATHFNTATVLNIRLRRVGSTFEGVDEQFITSTSRDFHPTDVIEDADGSLLMIDTGGWFLISCPFSKVSKPDVMGAIYRIRKIGSPNVVDQRGLALDWSASDDEIATRLDDHRPAVRDRAIETLAIRGPSALAELAKVLRAGSETARLNAIWSLSRIDTETAHAHLRQGLKDEADRVRQASIRSVGVLRDREAVADLHRLVTSQSWPIRRAAATALGQIGATESIPHIFTALTMPGDDHLRHALVYALIEIGNRDAMTPGLVHTDPRVQHAALMALDQMEHGHLTRKQVAPLIGSSDQMLRNTALRIVTSRPGWSDEIIDVLSDWTNSRGSDLATNELARTAIVSFSNETRLQHIVSAALQSTTISPTVRDNLLRALGGIRNLPKTWLKPLAQLLSSGNPSQQLEVIAALTTSGSTQLHEQVLAAGSNARNAADVRLAAWICLAETGSELPDAAFESLAAALQHSNSPLDRLAAAGAMTKASLNRRQTKIVIEMLPHTGAAVLPVLLDSLQQSTSGDNELTQLFTTVRGQVENRLSRQQPGDHKALQRMQRLMSTLGPGDRQHGKALFESNRAACSACHTVAGSGGDVGPDLSRIGQIRRRPDLLESILYPSASIANSYETYTVVTNDGRTAQGIVQRSDSQWLVLRDSQRKEIMIARRDIEELTKAHHSIMPEGLDANLNSDELADLLAYLEALKGDLNNEE